MDNLVLIRHLRGFLSHRLKELNYVPITKQVPYHQGQRDLLTTLLPWLTEHLAENSSSEVEQQHMKSRLQDLEDSYSYGRKKKLCTTHTHS